METHYYNTGEGVEGGPVPAKGGVYAPAVRFESVQPSFLKDFVQNVAAITAASQSMDELNTYLRTQKILTNPISDCERKLQQNGTCSFSCLCLGIEDVILSAKGVEKPKDQESISSNAAISGFYNTLYLRTAQDYATSLNAKKKELELKAKKGLEDTAQLLERFQDNSHQVAAPRVWTDQEIQDKIPRYEKTKLLFCQKLFYLHWKTFLTSSSVAVPTLDFHYTDDDVEELVAKTADFTKLEQAARIDAEKRKSARNEQKT